jgi:hypothetical protein
MDEEWVYLLLRVVYLGSLLLLLESHSFTSLQGHSFQEGLSLEFPYQPGAGREAMEDGGGVWVSVLPFIIISPANSIYSRVVCE